MKKIILLSAIVSICITLIGGIGPGLKKSYPYPSGAVWSQYSPIKKDSIQRKDLFILGHNTIPYGITFGQLDSLFGDTARFSIPATQIAFGTGTGTSSDPNFTWNSSTGKFNILGSFATFYVRNDNGTVKNRVSNFWQIADINDSKILEVDASASYKGTSLIISDTTKTITYTSNRNIFKGHVKIADSTQLANGTLMCDTGGNAKWILYRGLPNDIDSIATTLDTIRPILNHRTIVTASGTISTATIKYPSSPSDGDVIQIHFNYAIMGLGWTGGATDGTQSNSVNANSIGFDWSATYVAKKNKWY